LWRWLAQAINQLKMIKTRTTTARKSSSHYHDSQNRKKDKNSTMLKNDLQTRNSKPYFFNEMQTGSRNYDLYKKANIIILLIITIIVLDLTFPSPNNYYKSNTGIFL